MNRGTDDRGGRTREPHTPQTWTFRGASGFTLIEVLVVVAIIALLVAILTPALTRAREQTRLVTCGSHLHQIGLGIATYAQTFRTIPFGPDVQPLGAFVEGNDGSLATNQVWTGPQEPLKSKMALGLLIRNGGIFPELLYCPGDDSNDPVEELDKIEKRKLAPAYSSYLYRQLHEANPTGRLEDLGRNSLGRRATALAMDMNCVATFDPNYYRTNHRARRVNILYVDTSVRAEDNPNGLWSLRDQDFADLVGRRAELLQQADARY